MLTYFEELNFITPLGVMFLLNCLHSGAYIHIKLHCQTVGLKEDVPLKLCVVVKGTHTILIIGSRVGPHVSICAYYYSLYVDAV